MKATVFGVGIMDAGYRVQIFETVNGKQKRIWICPYYDTWYSMIRRCYSSVTHKSRPTYIGCSVVNDWLTFSTFKIWMEKQDWEGKHLDKDLMIKGNKLYGPDTCKFVTKQVNAFICEKKSSKGDFMIGVTYRQRDNYEPVWVATTTWRGKSMHIGHYRSEISAHIAWLKKKRELASILAGEQEDPDVAIAIIDRYNVESYQ